MLCLRTAAAKGAGKPSGRSDHGSMRTLPIDRAARLLDTPPHFVVRTVFRKGPRMSGTTITDRSTPTAMGSGCVRRDTLSVSFARSRQGTVASWRTSPSVGHNDRHNSLGQPVRDCEESGT